jgi:Mrp family chromosome partitioning ATPase
MTHLVRNTNRLLFEIPVERGFTRPADVPNHKLDPALTMTLRDPGRLEAHYRSAAEGLRMRSGGRLSHVFVTSPRTGDGKTCTAINLAWSLARAGKRVLLAELNFSRPRLLSAFGNLRVRYGLENALRGWVDPSDAIFSLVTSGLHVAPLRNATPAERLDPVLEHLSAFFDWSAARYESVIFDCPSVLSPEWDAWFGISIGAALLVVREGRTPLVEVRQAMERLGAGMKGILLNGAQEAPGNEDTGNTLFSATARSKTDAGNRPIAV